MRTKKIQRFIEMNNVYLLTVIALNVTLLLIGIGAYQNQAYGQGSLINDTHYLFENGTVYKITPEDFEEAKEGLETIMEAMRRLGMEEGVLPRNESLVKTLNETRIKEAMDLIENRTKDKTPTIGATGSGNRLEILSSSSYIDDIGYFHVVGEVKNNSPTAVSFVQVSGTFYDINNKVVGTTFSYTNPSDIVPGGTAPFDLTLLSASVPISEISTYKLSASAQ